MSLSPGFLQEVEFGFKLRSVIPTLHRLYIMKKDFSTRMVFGAHIPRVCRFPLSLSVIEWEPKQDWVFFPSPLPEESVKLVMFL